MLAAGTIPWFHCTTAVHFLDLGQVAALAASSECALRDQTAGRQVSLSWIMLGLVGWALGLMFVLVLMRMAGDQDRAARHEQKRLDPFVDVTITRYGPE